MNISQKISKLKDGIRKHSPIVAEFFDREDRIIDYAKSLYKVALDDEQLKRQKELIIITQKEILRIFGKKIKLSSPLVSNIVDHHSWLNHPIMIATNTVANAHKLLERKNDDYILVYSSSIVPPNNFFNKKGFVFRRKKIPIFSNKDMHQASCFIPKHDFRFIQRLKEMKLFKEFSPKDQEFLEKLQKKIEKIDFSRGKNYNDQISIIDNWIWKHIFNESIRKKIPELMYITQENILAEALPKILQEKNIISQTLFNEKMRSAVLERFDGLVACWDTKKFKGTHFFWYKNNKNEAGRMFYKDGYLISEDEKLKIALTPDNISSAIKKGVIIPNLFIVFGYLTFWCGVKPLVGHGSGNYLTQMKEAWLDVIKDESENKRIASIDTKSLIGGAMVTFGRGNDNVIEAKYAMDVIADGGLQQEYLEKLLYMKFNDLLAPALLEIYESYVPLDEREDLGLRASDLMGNVFNWIK